VIEVRATGGPLAEAAQSCSGVLGPGRCRAVDAEADAVGPRFHVVVVFDDAAQRAARIELHEASDDALRAARSVRFGVDDTLIERYRAIGLIAAAQVLSIEPDLARPSKPPEPPAPQRSRPKEENAPTPAAPDYAWGLDLGAVGGVGLDDGAPRLGALARPWWSPFEPVALELGLRVAARPDDPLVTWSSVSLGAALRLTPQHSPLSVRFRAGARATRVVASTDAAGQSDSSAALQLGPELGAELSWPQASSAAAFLGAEIEIPRPRLRVQVRGREAGEVPNVVAGGVLGVRLGF
jgi:hypothetical protein